MSYLKFCIYIFSAYLITSYFSIVWAQQKFTDEITGSICEAELQKLPDIIEIKTRIHLGQKKPAYLKYYKKFMEKYGEGYNMLHHFGKGVIYLNRLYTYQFYGFGRKRTMNQAINELGYSLDPDKIKRYSKIFITKFLPTIFSKRGEAYLINNQVDKAFSDFLSAVKIDPNYVRAYAMLGICYKIMGNIDMAKKMEKLSKKTTLHE